MVRELRGQPKELIAQSIATHLEQVHKQAMSRLEGWSGPYHSEEDSAEYYYNDQTNLSIWESPVAEWEYALQTRYAVLFRCLLPEALICAAPVEEAREGGGLKEATESAPAARTCMDAAAFAEAGLKWSRLQYC